MAEKTRYAASQRLISLFGGGFVCPPYKFVGPISDSASGNDYLQVTTVLNKLSRLLADAGISLTDHQKNQLIAYVDMLHKWNKAYNLTSVRDPNEMLVRHILDSIVVAPYLKGERFIDVGTGPGLPGSSLHRTS
jgi:16S rRNA (guanine527-N7)-methyltransferase